MKKNLLVVIVVVVSLSMGMVSCSKESEENITPKEVVKIFMNAPSKSGLKSALINEKKAIASGDTAYVWDIPDVNITIFAEDEFGLPIEGSWSIFNTENDRDINRFDTIAIGSGGGGALGSALSTKLKFFGIYLVNFTSKAGTEKSFYILHRGMPGILGDDWKNNYVFRLDKENYQINNVQNNTGYTLYLKYEEGEFPIIKNEDQIVDLNLTKNFHALLYCGGNNIFVSHGGFQYQAKEFSLKRCKYSPGYVCFSFLSESTPARDGKYEVYFYTGIFGSNYWGFQSVTRSDWSKDERIVFQTI